MRKLRHGACKELHKEEPHRRVYIHIELPAQYSQRTQQPMLLSHSFPHLSFPFLHALLPSYCVLSHITDSLLFALSPPPPISLLFPPVDRGIISIWLQSQVLNILAFLKEAICFLLSNVSHAVKWHWLVPSLTKFHRDGLSEAREPFEKWASSLWKYPNYHFLWETHITPEICGHQKT